MARSFIIVEADWCISFVEIFCVCILMQLGPKTEDVKKPVNKFVFLMRFLLGGLAATYFVLVPIYMWIKDKIVPKGLPI